MIAVVLLAADIPAAEAGPLVPSGDLPGRERYRSRTRRRGRSCSGSAVRAADGGESAIAANAALLTIGA